MPGMKPQTSSQRAAQAKITDIFARKPQTFSFEFFPPKTPKGERSQAEAAETFARAGADFFSVTYGAGGSTREKTLRIVRRLLDDHSVAVMHHLTCIKHTYEEIRQQLQEMRDAGVRNIMALRGDPPADDPDYTPGPNQPHYAYQLVEEIRRHGDWFAVGVACFPEGHPMAPSLDDDIRYLKVKQDAGADFAVTQLFFDPDMYSRLRERAERQGVTMRLVPGIYPITDIDKAQSFCDNCGATIPDAVREAFEPLRGDKKAMREKGTELAIRQGRELLDRGAPGLHFYCLNRVEPALTIYRTLAP